MKRLILMIVFAALLAGTNPRQAEAVSTETLAKTFALTLAGTVGGAYVLPYLVPMVAPTVSAAYTAVVGTALDGITTTIGSYLILEPRMIGAVAGMTAGLIGGLTFFDDDVAKAEIAEKATTNSAIQLKR
jgi:hypothetical protein